LKSDKENALTLNNNMDNKTNAIVLIVVALIFLFVVIAFKIKSDKKRKSLVISTAEREKDIGLVKNESQGKKPYLAGIPSWTLALIAMFGIFIVLMVIGESIKIDTIIGEVLTYIILGIVNGICCFFIVRQNPISIWYVPLIMNVIYIISAVVESMKTSAWVAICGILALSLIASIIGARVGRRKTVSKTPKIL
jgi:hypothetical protein